jgi:hypothetical protein
VVDVQELARQHTPEAITALVAALKRPKEAVPAAIALLNRGWGTPVQTVHTEGRTSIGLLHLVAAQAVGGQLQVELGVTPAASAEPQPSQPLTIEALAALPPPTE